MNIINQIQNNIKQWNHYLNCLQNQTPTITIRWDKHNNVYGRFFTIFHP
jgi:hypothetical protein